MRIRSTWHVDRGVVRQIGSSEPPPQKPVVVIVIDPPKPRLPSKREWLTAAAKAADPLREAKLELRRRIQERSK